MKSFRTKAHLAAALCDAGLPEGDALDIACQVASQDDEITRVRLQQILTAFEDAADSFRRSADVKANKASAIRAVLEEEPS